jgi:hypothetical protein
MPNLYINDGRSDVSVGELGIVLGKQQVILGNFERDFILRTAGNIKVQVGNKMYDLPFTSTDSTDTSVAVTAKTSIINTEADLATLAYPGDGSFVYVIQDKAFYIANNSTYILLAKPTDSTVAKLFLAYDSTQNLTGTQKRTVVLNTGSYITSFSNISSFSVGDVYSGQLIYSIADGKHYRLINATAPSTPSSWEQVYLSISGGLVRGNVTISPSGGNQTNTALHISGSYPFTSLGTIATVQPILSVGLADLTSGLAVWSNAGNVYLQSLAKNSNRGFNFVTGLDNGSVKTPLSVSRNNVSIGGPLNYNYSLNVIGNSFTSSTAVFDSNLKSTGYIAGPTGAGFSLYKDGTSTYTLEVDHLIVRNATGTPGTIYSTDGLAGSIILDYVITVQTSELLESFPIYISAQVSGRYINTSGTPRLLSTRARKVKVVHTAVSDLDLIGSLTPPSKVYETITLSYAIGDINDDLSPDTTTTYNQDVSTTYYTPTGDTSYDAGTTSFIPDVSGTLLKINDIAVYFVQTTSQASVVVGDLLYFKQWNDNKTFSSAIHAEVVDVVSDGYYIYAYDGISVVPGTQFIKVGNASGTGSMIQLNSSDMTSPYIELLSGLTSFRDFYENYYFEKATDFIVADDLIEDSWSLKAHTRVKVGDLSNITDTDLALSTQEYGIYSDNAYVKGNFVVQRGIYNSVPLTSTVSPILMLDGSNMMQTIDLSTKITHWDTAYGWGNHALAGYALQSITMSAGTGLTGGGDLSANRTLSLDLTYLDGRYASSSTAVSNSGVFSVGDIPSPGNSFTVSLPNTLPDTNYMVVTSLEPTGGTDEDNIATCILIKNKTTSSFDFYIHESSSITQALNVVWATLAISP